jgi:hypothetical protein
MLEFNRVQKNNEEYNANKLKSLSLANLTSSNNFIGEDL